MMKRTLLQKAVACMMTICLLTLICAAALPHMLPKAEAAPASTADFPQAQSFMALCEQAQGSESHQEGDWVYAVIMPQNYAVILAHTGVEAASLRVPDRLGGADVVGLAPGALADHRQLTSVSLPGNVNAVGQGSIPAGTLVQGYHGTYAYAYALENGYAFQSLSAYDFAPGVIDYADIRTDAFTRHSAHSLTLRALEASRLQEGSVFFLVDPENAYQISYYRVVTMKDHGSGYVDVQCETPVSDEVLQSFRGVNEQVMLDVSTLQLNDGVTLRNARNGSPIKTVDLDLKMKFKVLNCDVTVTGGYSADFSVPEYAGEEDSKKSATLELKETLKGTFKVETDLNAADDLLKHKQFKDIKEMAQTIGEHAGRLQSASKMPYRYPLGMGIAFSYAGLVTIEASFAAEFEISGGGSITIDYETVTTYSGDTDGNATKSNVVESRNVTPEGSIKIKAGVKAQASLYLTAVCVFQVSGFAGFELTLSYGAASWDWSDGSMNAGVNTLDTLSLKAFFIVEVGIKAGILKVFHMDVPLEVSVQADFKLVNVKLLDKHLHLVPVVYYVDLLSGKLINSGIVKNIEHNAEDCPYGKSSLEVRLSRKVGNQQALLYEFDYLDPGFIMGEPDDPTEAYDEYRIFSWHSSTKPTAANRISFPYTIVDGDNVLYANVQQKRHVHFIYEDGTEIGPAQYLFPGETIHLPATDPDKVILKWAQVESPAFLVERNDVTIDQGSTELIMPVVHSDIYLCAFEAPEIHVNFYESVNGAPMYKTGSVVSKAGLTVEKPEDTEMCARFDDFGWQEVMGEDITFPYAVPAGKIVDVSLVHFLGKKPAEHDFTWMSGIYEGSPYPMQGDMFTYEIRRGSDYGDYVVITGRYTTDQNGNPSPTRHLFIPDRYVGYPVLGIDTGAFYECSTLETVTISSRLNYIGPYAFKGCTNLRMVDLTADDYLRINERAFENCTNLTDLRLDEYATIYYGDESFRNTGLVSVYASSDVGRSAFADCRNLQRVTIPSFCESIDFSAFTNCTSLREVHIEPGLDYINQGAFSGCTSLLELTIPDGTSCGKDIVEGCTQLEKLVVGGPAKPGEFLAIPALAYDNSSNNLPSLRHVEIGEGYTSIGKAAFKNMYLLETVVLPQNMENIGDEAFYATGISEITNTSLKQIGARAFASNPRLQTVNISAPVITEQAFENCPALKTVTLTGTTEIKHYAFANCVSLEELHLSDDIATIGAYAFSGCESLTEFPAIKGLKTIRYNVFADCVNLKKITLAEGLQTVENHVFKNCSSLEELIFPDSVTLYGNGTGNNASLIDGCTSLRKLYIGGGYSNTDPYHNNALYSDVTFHIGPGNVVEYVEFGEGVTAIHEPFDEYYTNVETLILPSTLERIGCTHCEKTFEHFGIRSLTIKGQIRFITNEAFNNCQRLETVVIEGDDAIIYSFCFANTPELKTCEMTGVKELHDSIFDESGIETLYLGEGIQTIKKGSFTACRFLRSIHIADTLKNIQGLQDLGSCDALEEIYVGGIKQVRRLFYSAAPRSIEFGPGVEEIIYTPVESLANLERLVLPEGLISVSDMSGIGPKLKELVLPQSLEHITPYAFSDGQFETVDIPANVKTIEYNAFYNNPRLKKVVIYGDDVVIEEQAFYNCPQLTELVVVGSIKSIGKYAFYNCGFEELTIPDGLETVGEYAFANCLNLKRLVLPNTLQTVERFMLHGSTNLEYLAMGGPEKVPSTLFGSSQAYNLQCLELGEGVKAIESYAFDSTEYEFFPRLETVIFPSTLEEVGYKAFYNIPIRTLVIDSGNLRSIDSYAFQSCDQLESIVIHSAPGGAIKSSAFSGCTALTNIELHNIADIGEDAFYYCTALTELNLPASLIRIGTSAFARCFALSTLNLPEGLEEIGGSAFKDDVSLTSVVIPNSVTRLPGYRIFDGCSGITRLTIGAGVDFSSHGGSTITAGLPDQMEIIELAEGITDMQLIVLSYDQYSEEHVDTVILPESMTTIKASMMRSLYGASHVKLSSSVDTYVPYDGFIYYDQDLVNTTLYTNTYNNVVASIAEELGATYVSLDGMTDCQVQLCIALDGAAGVDAFMTLDGNMFSGITLPDAPAREGYRFTGWYHDAACTKPVQGSLRFTKNMTLYAGYMPNDVTVFVLKLPPFTTLEGLAESALVPEDYLLYAKLEQAAGASTSLPATPALEGYAFTGWYLDPTLYMPYRNAAVQRHPAMLYGGFTTAGQGGMFEAGEDGLILTSYRPTEMDGLSITLPEQIGGKVLSGIGKRAFAGLEALDITLPPMLTTVDPEAFSGAASLRRLSISAANASFSTLNGVLYNKDRTVLIRCPEAFRLSSFTVPDTVRIIAPHAFENCTGLQQVVLPDGLESIGDYAFAQTGLKKITLPDSVLHLGAHAFEGCWQMTRLEAYGLQTVGDQALPATLSLAVRGPLLQGALRDAAVTPGSANLRYNIRYLSVWHEGQELTAYSVEAGMPLPQQAWHMTIGTDSVVYALYTDAELTQPCTITAMPDEDVALYADVRPVFAAQPITLEDGSTGMMITAYNGHGGAVVLPRRIGGLDVVALGDNMLATALGEVTAIEIGSAVRQIADTALHSADGTPFAGTVYADANSFATTWAQQKGFKVAASVYTISFNSMGGSRVPAVQAAAGTQVRLQQPVRTGYAFSGWYVDEACTTAAQLDENGLYAVPGESTTLFAAWSSTEEEVPAFTFTEAGEGIVITGYTGSDTIMRIPESINGVAVTGIADRAFAGNERITAVEMPQSLLRIGASAFARMPALAAVTLPNNVESIGYAAFRDCVSLQTVHLGAGLTNIGEQAFRGCASLSTFTVSAGGRLTLANGVLYADEGATLVCCPMGFKGELSIPQGVTRIMPYALAESGVTAITIPDSVDTLGEGALYDCDSLTALVIGDGKSTLYLPDRLLLGADALTSIHLGSRIYSVGDSAFFGCAALAEAYISPEVMHISDTAFSAVSKALVITGSRGSAAHAYAKENGFTFIAEGQQDVESLSFPTDSITLTLGQQATLTVTAKPALPDDEPLRWTSSNADVVYVSSGTVHALGRGTAVVTATAANGVKAEITIHVKGTPAETLTLTPETLDVCTGGQAALTAVATPAWADTTCQWVSDDPAIATVDQFGVVTGVKAGETIIRAQSESGCRAEAKVVVYKPVEEIRLTEGSASMTLNVIDHPTLQICAAAYPEDATYKQLLYESSDTEVVTVSNSGLITVQGTGAATITVTSLYAAGEPVTLVLRVKVVPYDISQVPAPEAAPIPYSGYSEKPKVKFTIGHMTLTSGWDYTIENHGTSSLGQHSYTLTGIGLFTGTLTGTYEIVELQTTVSYTGDAVYEYGNVWLSISSNASSRVKYAYALQSDPDTWTDGKPAEVGDYILRMYIPDAYGIIGCEDTAEISIVPSFIKQIVASADTIHLLAGQTVSVLIDLQLVDGITYFNPSMYKTIVDENSVISYSRLYSMSGVRQRILDLRISPSAEGEAEITLYRANRKDEAVTVKVHVHKNAATFRLPGATQIKAEAFMNTAANIIRLEGKTAAIGARAFKDAASLWQVVLPDGSVTIAPDALEGTGAVLVCPDVDAPSALEAEKAGIPYIVAY